MAEEEVERPRTDEGGFAHGEEGGKFGGGSDSPAYAGADEQWRGEEPGEDDRRRETMEQEQRRREETSV